MQCEYSSVLQRKAAGFYHKPPSKCIPAWKDRTASCQQCSEILCSPLKGVACAGVQREGVLAHWQSTNGEAHLAAGAGWRDRQLSEQKPKTVAG